MKEIDGKERIVSESKQIKQKKKYLILIHMIIENKNRSSSLWCEKSWLTQDKT